MDFCTTRKMACAALLGFTAVCAAIGLRVAGALTSPDLVLVKTPSQSAVMIGQPYSYNITATNIGGITATNVVITDSIPSGVDIGQIRAGCIGIGGCTLGLAQNGRTISVTVNQIAPSTLVTFSTIVTPVVAGQITNTAYITFAGVDASEANNFASAVVTISGTTTNTLTQTNYLPLVLRQVLTLTTPTIQQ